MPKLYTDKGELCKARLDTSLLAVHSYISIKPALRCHQENSPSARPGFLSCWWFDSRLAWNRIGQAAALSWHRQTDPVPAQQREAEVAQHTSTKYVMTDAVCICPLAVTRSPSSAAGVT